MVTQAELRNILRPRGGPIENPERHLNLQFHNEVAIDVRGPEGIKQHVEHVGNIMCTHGLNRLIEMLASDSDGASDWVSAMAVGTDNTAAASTQDSLIASTAIKHLSQASMVATDGGNMTLQYEATFDDSNVYQCHEVGLFATNNATENMVARSVLGASSINKLASDTIEITYKVVAGTA